jgi:hypothetical protein
MSLKDRDDLPRDHNGDEGARPDDRKDDTPGPDDFTPGEDHDAEEVAPARGPSLADIEALRLDDDADDDIDIEEVVTTIRVGKPPKGAYVRTYHDNKDRCRWLLARLIVDERELYLVDKSLHKRLHGIEPLYQPRLLVTAITVMGEVFLWPLRLPPASGTFDTWGRSENAAADLARTTWVRVTADQDAKGYKVGRAAGVLPEPHWPDLPPLEVVRLAFLDRYIRTLDHPKLRALRGEV